MRIRAFLRARASSRQTRKANADMDRVLLFTALSPLATNGVPTLYLLVALNLNANIPLLDVMNSACVFISLVLAPISTIWFVR